MGAKLRIFLIIFFLSNAFLAEDYPTKVFLLGNWADPSIVKYQDTYYLSADNDHYIPSIMIFKSKDLFNWEPVTYVSPEIEQGPAIDLAVYNDTMYIYGGGGEDVWVYYAEPPFKKWSDRISLEPLVPHGIDPGHAADEKGNRYLFTNEGKLLKLSRNGLKAVTVPKVVYEGWEIPDSIDIECVCLESPKLFRKNEYYFMISAQGGTAGPPTSHMAVVARSKNIDGPWENSPYNPLIWTSDLEEEWWSKGHASLIEGPDGKWAAFYHGYLKGQRSLGRATLISPVVWTEDNWPIIGEEWHKGWDKDLNVTWQLSDDFENGKLGYQWQVLDKYEYERYAIRDGSLFIEAMDTDEPGNSFPLSVNPNSTSYEIITELEVEAETIGGLIMMYKPDVYYAIGFSGEGVLKKYGRKPAGKLNFWKGDTIKVNGNKIKLKIVNSEQTVSYFCQPENGKWIKLESSDDISGFQHNIFGRFTSVHPGLFSIGKGNVRFNYFIYNRLN